VPGADLALISPYQGRLRIKATSLLGEYLFGVGYGQEQVVFDGRTPLGGLFKHTGRICPYSSRIPFGIREPSGFQCSHAYFSFLVGKRSRIGTEIHVVAP
jgi:hypothetical protein